MRTRSFFTYLLFALFGLFASELRAQTYDVIPLGSLGGSDPTPYGINDKGEVVGYSYVANNLIWQAFLWKNGVMSNLGPFGVYSMAYRINEQSQAVGFVKSGAFTLEHAYLWDNGLNTDLNPSYGKYSKAAAINDLGQVVGSFYDTTSKAVHTFRWENGVLTDMGKLGGINFSGALGINNQGQIIGNYDRRYTVDTFQANYVGAYFYDNGGVTDMGKLTYPEEINNFGQVAGYTYFDYNGYSTCCQGFSWKNGTKTLIKTSESATSRAFGINDSGEVVGWTYNQTGHQVAFIWKDGVLKDLNTMIDSGSPWRLRQANAINNKGEIVGIGDWYTYQSFAFLLRPKPLTVTKPQGGEALIAGETDTIRWANAPVGGLLNIFFSQDGASYTTVAEGVAADDGYFLWKIPHKETATGRIAISSVSDASKSDTTDPFIIQEFAIFKPFAGERWISGKRDTIRWMRGAEGDLFNIFFSQDGGAVYSMIGENIPADSGYYAWNIPEGILSTDCYIMITLASDLSVDATSDRFRVKGYQLARYDAMGKYDPFQFGRDNWNFSNTEDKMWPKTWWQQFDYAHAIDPYTHTTYPGYFTSWPIKADTSDFVDWPLWVNIFGVIQCYYDTSLGLYIPSSIQRWAARKGKWGGSCSGFAYSSLLLFGNPTAFLAAYPTMGTFTTTFASNHNPDRRTLINRLWGIQMGLGHSWSYLWQGLTTNPKETIYELQEMFLSDTRDDRPLAIINQNGSGAHAITPYRLASHPGNPSLVDIYVYDNNHAGNNTLRIIVDTVANFWTYSDWPTWGGTSGLLLMDNMNSYLTRPLLPKTEPDSPFTQDEPAPEEIYFSHASTIKILNAAGDTTGYVDGRIVKDDSVAIPIIPITGSEQPPIGFMVAPGIHTISLADFQDSTVSLSMFGDSTLYVYHRADAESTQSDVVEWLNGITVSNSEGSNKIISMKGIATLATEEHVFNIDNLLLGGDDSIGMDITGKNTLTVTNHGGPTSYALSLEQVSAAGAKRFLHPSIALAGNSSQLVMPNWSDPELGDVVILTDQGNDGSYEDTTQIVNQETGVDEGGTKALPKEYTLHQNYPNPFNPRTTITYELPRAAYVTLKIYDPFGREVAILVDEREEAGFKSVDWNAAALASGVYFYRIQAGDFVNTKKLILLK